MSAHRAQLLRANLQVDESGKIRDFVALVRAFARVHHLISGGSDTGVVRGEHTIYASTAEGLLSCYTWTVLALHVLLRFQYVPNLIGNLHSTEAHAKAQDGDEKGSHTLGGVNVSFTSLEEMEGQPELLAALSAKMQQTSILQLLHTFFHYLVFEVDVFGSVLTTRGAGEVRSHLSYLQF
jgi:hypothetical protein